VAPESLQIQLARLEEQVKALRQIVEAASFIAQTANENQRRLDVHDERFRDFDQDIAAMEARMESAVSRVETSCNNLGSLIRTQQQTLAKVENEQDQQTKALTKREKYLLILAGALASGAVGLLVDRLG
jgi:peptidoglycan hydrolase CwlO-like protein